jgi:hypothetical protein
MKSFPRRLAAPANFVAPRAGSATGIKQVSDEIWLVTFMDYDLGYFDHETCRLEPLANPFGPKLLQLPGLEHSPSHSKAASGFATRCQREDKTKVLPLSPE